MTIVARIAFEEPVAVRARFPFNNWTILRVAQLARIATRVVCDVVVALFAFVTIFLTSKEGRHAGNDVIVVVMVIKVYVFFCRWTGINEGIEVVF